MNIYVSERNESSHQGFGGNQTYLKSVLGSRKTVGEGRDVLIAEWMRVAVLNPHTLHQGLGFRER